MGNEVARATIRIDKGVMRAAKKKALENEITFKKLVEEALIKNLGLEKETKKVMGNKFGKYKMGKIKGTLSRDQIYDFV